MVFEGSDSSVGYQENVPGGSLEGYVQLEAAFVDQALPRPRAFGVEAEL